MVKAYLRYAQEGPAWGVIASANSNIVFASGKLLLTASLENVSVWNVKQGTLVSPVAMRLVVGSAGITCSGLASVPDLPLPSHAASTGPLAVAAAVRVWQGGRRGDPNSCLARGQPGGRGPRRWRRAAVEPGHRRLRGDTAGPPLSRHGAALQPQRSAAGQRRARHRRGGLGRGRRGGAVSPARPPRRGDRRRVCGARAAPGQQQQG